MICNWSQDIRRCPAPCTLSPPSHIRDLFIEAKVDSIKNGEVPTKAVGQREPYRSHITKLYIDGVLHGKLPLVTTDPRYLEAQAKEYMDKLAFGFVSGGAGELATMDANRLAFRQWKIIPRFLRPCTPRDLRTELFGITYESPLLMAPVGVQGVFHPQGELALAPACGELGIPYIMSTAASNSIEDVSKACGDNPKWYQLYWPEDDEIAVSFLQRAKACGFTTLVVTLDTPTVGWRPADLDIANLPFLKGMGSKVGFSDPVFRRKFAAKSNGQAPEHNILDACRYWMSQAFRGDHPSWDDLKLLKDNWDGPIVLKGIQSVEDAKLALEHGMHGIVVSNHGGRQVDGCVGALEMLPEIVDAVGDKMTILFDSGIRTGPDIIKALALGAKGVMVSRPAIYGLGIGGKEGAKSVLAGLLADLDQSMGISGYKSVKELTRDILRRTEYGGDVKAMF